MDEHQDKNEWWVYADPMSCGPVEPPAWLMWMSAAALAGVFVWAWFN